MPYFIGSFANAPPGLVCSMAAKTTAASTSTSSTADRLVSTGGKSTVKSTVNPEDFCSSARSTRRSTRVERLVALPDTYPSMVMLDTSTPALSAILPLKSLSNSALKAGSSRSERPTSVMDTADVTFA